ncbi:cytochrome P450 6k1-like [Cherax quadricarinatus]
MKVNNNANQLSRLLSNDFKLAANLVNDVSTPSGASHKINREPNYSMRMGVEVWLLVAALMLAAWLYSRWRHNYWSSHGILCPPYLPFLGHIHKRISLFQSRWDYLDEVYYKYGGSTMSGLYDMFHPVLMIGDPELLKHILVKDFDHFVDRRLFMAEDGSLINEMLSNKTGDEWRALRAVMTPTFTSGKMRSMFPLICDKADSLVSFTLKEASQKPYVDMKVNFGRFTMDTIASCAFGIECNSFTSEVPEFAKLAKTFFDFSLIRLIKFTFLNMYPKICNAIGIKIEPFSVKFFISVVEETIAARKAGQKRGDYLDLLLAARDGHLTQEVSTTHTQSTTTATENQVSITHDSNALETNKTFITSSKQGQC